MKIAIVTSILGECGTLYDPKNIFEADYFSFSDNDYDVKIWKKNQVYKFSIDDKKFINRRNAKIFKIMPFIELNNYDYWIWTDATHEVISNPHDWIPKYMKNDGIIGVFKHTSRDCVFDEAQEVIRLNYDREILVNNQMNLYKQLQYPIHNGLYELPVFVIKNCNATKTLCLQWWEQICRYSSRDQLSLPFVLWRLKIQPTILPGLANGGLYQNDLMPQVRIKGQ